MWKSLSVDELLIKLSQNTLSDAASDDDDFPNFYCDLAHKIGGSVEVNLTLSYTIYITTSTPLHNPILFYLNFHSFVKRIRNNWRTGKFSLSQLSLGNSDAVQIDQKKLVFHKCCGHIDIHFSMKERKDLLSPETV